MGQDATIAIAVVVAARFAFAFTLISEFGYILSVIAAASYVFASALSVAR